MAAGVTGPPPAAACVPACDAGANVDGTPLNRAHGTVPAASVPMVVRLEVPAHVDRAVLSSGVPATYELPFHSHACPAARPFGSICWGEMTDVPTEPES